MTKTGWFATQRLAEGTFLVGEPMHVNNYLVVGSERAVLLDTGMGIASIKAVVDSLTDKPLLVVNSHHHFDHVGGNHEFPDIAIHRSGSELLQAGPPARWLESYWESFQEVLAQYQVFRDIDQAWFQVLAPEMQMRQPPEGFEPGDWPVPRSVPNRLLDDGEELDLGDRTLRVLHTPGHSPDAICLLDESQRMLFSGDTVDTGPLYAHLAGGDVDEFAVSARRLADEVPAKVDTVLSAHGARYRSYPELLGRVADAFDAVRAGEVDYAPAVDCFQGHAKQASFNDFSIVVPQEYGV